MFIYSALLIPRPYTWHWVRAHRTDKGKVGYRATSVISYKNLAQTRLSKKGVFIGLNIQSISGLDLGLEAIDSRGKDSVVRRWVGFVTSR